MTDIVQIPVPVPYPIQWVNCWYIRDSIPTLVDTGINSDEALSAIGAEVAKHGDSIRDLGRIIITHGHGDHIGLAGRIADLSGAEVFVHPLDATRILAGPGEPLRERQGRILSFLIDGGTSRGEASELLEIMLERHKGIFSILSQQTMIQGGEVFQFDDFDLEVIHTPGHTPGSLALLNRKDGVLFCGDSLIEEITFNPALESDGEEPVTGYMSLAAYRSSLDLIERLPVNKALPGHGSPFSDVAGTIEKLRRHHEARSEEILKLLKASETRYSPDEPPTRDRITREMFGAAEGPELFYRLGAVHVHLSDLAAKGLIAAVERDPISWVLI